MEQQLNPGQEPAAGEMDKMDSKAQRPGALAYFSGLAGVSLALTVTLWPLSSLLFRNAADLPLFPNSNIFWAHIALAVASLIFGVAAVLFGRIAVSRDQSPEKLWLRRGKRGVILGLFSLALLLIFFMLSTLTTSSAPPKDTTPREEIQRMNSRIA